MARRETPSQVASRALTQAQRRNAPYILQKALIEAGIVESGLQHQKYERVGSGDRDSIGFLQQRPSAGWGGPQSIETDTNQFIDHGLALLKRGFKGSSGELAQAIQVSAFPGRYNQVSGRATSIIGRRGGADAPAGGGSADPGAGSLPAGTAPDLGSAQSLVPLLQALKSQPQPRSSAGIAAPAFSAQAALPGGYQSPVSGGGPAPRTDINALLAAVQTAGGSVPGAQQQGATPGASGSGAASASFTTPKLASGVASFEGKKVAAWIAPALDYARRHGWKGTVNSGYRSFADQQRIYNSGVRPAAKPGTSNHEGTQFPRGAVDVSDAARLAEILRRSPYGGRLKWAGAKDPVHFSHPHGGSY